MLYAIFVILGVMKIKIKMKQIPKSASLASRRKEDGWVGKGFVLKKLREPSSINFHS
jgi:hypothetical protein